MSQDGCGDVRLGFVHALGEGLLIRFGADTVPALSVKPCPNLSLTRPIMHISEFRRAASSSVPDWSRETIVRFWEPGKKLLRSIRRWQALRHRTDPVARIFRTYWKYNHMWWSVITQCEIHLGTSIGGGLLLPHPCGIIIHPEAKIGPNCLIFQQVTFGGRVSVAGHVDIGAGAKLLGSISVGEHVQVGANAVVTRDLPSNCVAVGIPAVIKTRPEILIKPQAEQVHRAEIDR